MRLTSAHKYALLSIAVPALVVLFWVFVGVVEEMLTSSTRELGDAETYLTTVLILGSLTLFPTLALVSARPTGHWTKRARDTVLCVLSLVFLVFGSAPLIAKIADPAMKHIDIFSLLLPLGLWIGYSSFRELYPGFHLSFFVVSILNFVLVVVCFVVLGAGTLILLTTLFPSVRDTPIPSVLILLPPALFLGLPVINAVVNRRSKGLGLRPAVMAFSCIQPGHRWEKMPQETAMQAWQKMHSLPEGGRFEDGWTCTHCPVIRLDCERAGERCVLYGNLFKQPWGIWLGGVVVAHMAPSKSNAKGSWSLRAHQRLDYDWIRMDQELMAAEASKHGAVNGHLPVSGWRSGDPGAERFDFVDSDARDFTMVLNVDPDDEPSACFGLFLMFARTPTLASDTTNPRALDQPPTSSNSPTNAQPSSA